MRLLNDSRYSRYKVHCLVGSRIFLLLFLGRWQFQRQWFSDLSRSGSNCARFDRWNNYWLHTSLPPFLPFFDFLMWLFDTQVSQSQQHIKEDRYTFAYFFKDGRYFFTFYVATHCTSFWLRLHFIFLDCTASATVCRKNFPTAHHSTAKPMRTISPASCLWYGEKNKQ